MQLSEGPSVDTLETYVHRFLLLSESHVRQGEDGFSGGRSQTSSDGTQGSLGFGNTRFGTPQTIDCFLKHLWQNEILAPSF